MLLRYGSSTEDNTEGIPKNLFLLERPRNVCCFAENESSFGAVVPAVTIMPRSQVRVSYAKVVEAMSDDARVCSRHFW